MQAVFYSQGFACDCVSSFKFVSSNGKQTERNPCIRSSINLCLRSINRVETASRAAGPSKSPVLPVTGPKLKHTVQHQALLLTTPALLEVVGLTNGRTSTRIQICLALNTGPPLLAEKVLFDEPTPSPRPGGRKSPSPAPSRTPEKFCAGSSWPVQPAGFLSVPPAPPDPPPATFLRATELRARRRRSSCLRLEGLWRQTPLPRPRPLRPCLLPPPRFFAEPGRGGPAGDAR